MACIYIYVYMYMYMYLFICIYTYINLPPIPRLIRLTRDAATVAAAVEATEMTYACIYISIYTYICVYLYYILIDRYIYIYIYIYINGASPPQVDSPSSGRCNCRRGGYINGMYIYVYMYMYAYIYIYIHTYINDTILSG